MKMSTLIKISLSALAITVSMPMEAGAMQARLRAAREAAQAQALEQQQALAQQQQAEAQPQREAEAQCQREAQALAQQQALARQQEEERRREVEAQRQREEAERRQREVEAQRNVQPVMKAPVILTPEQRLAQAIRSDVARFAFLTKNSEDDINETAEFRIQTLISSFEKNLPKDNDVLFFAEKVCQDGGANNRIHTRITRARHTLLIMKAINPALVNYFDEDAYQAGIRQRCYLYQYMDDKKFDRHNTNALIKSISDLKGLLNKRDDQALDFDRNLTFDTAINLEKEQLAFAQDQAEIGQAFQTWRGLLQVKANPENDLYKLQASDINGDNGDWQLDDEGHVFDLLQEWGEITGEIDRIADTKRNNPIRLNHQKLTYEDHYSSLFNIDYPQVTVEQINAIKADIIRAATVEHQAGRLTDFALEELKEQAELNFTSIINFDHLKNDRDHFKARAFLIYNTLPRAIVPPEIVRPVEGVEDLKVQQKWQEALTTAQYKIGDQLIMSLANCEAGVNRKLGNLEDKFKEILGSLEPKTSGIKAIASIIREIKLQRINELGRNTDPKRVEYNLNVPLVAKQRLRGPLSLGGNYESCSSAGLGCPFMQQNLPIQVIHNMFLPNQRDHVYYHGTVANENRNDEDNPILIFPPVKEHLTVKGLAEAVYNEFEAQTGYDQEAGRPITEGRIRKIHIDSLLHSDFFQMENIGSAAIHLTGTVFLQDRNGKGMSRGPRDLYTREMAFYLLERLGYVEINENIKKDVYQFDFAEELPGTTIQAGLLHGGKGKTLADLIDEF